jgi:hypothetical protein
MNDFCSTNSRPIPPVTVRRHPVDWEHANFDEVTGQRTLEWDRRISKGCWFLNPRYTVHSDFPTPAFFQKVREVQGSWLRTVRQSIHNRGLRQEARRRDPLGRQLAFSGILFIEGVLISPRTLQAQADKLLASNPFPRVSLPSKTPVNGPAVPSKSPNSIVSEDTQLDASASEERTNSHV